MTSSAFDLSQFGSQVTSLIDPENRIINGAMDFWQRGTSSTSGGYLADRWSNNLNGGTVTTSRQAFTVGDTLGTNNPTFFFRQTVSGQSTSAHFATTGHPIEGVRSYAGQTITILGWARRSSGSGNAAVDLVQYFGTGGSPSSSVLVAGQTLTLTSSFAPFALTFNVPSIAGKALGTNNNDFLNLVFWSSAGSDYNARTNSLGLQTIGVDLWGIHIRLGSQTVDAVQYYRQPELGPELARCQRYFCKNFNLQDAPLNGTYLDNRLTIGTMFNSTDLQCSEIAFPVTMRSTPSFTFYSPSFVSTSGRWAVYPMAWGGGGFAPSIVSASPYRLIAGGNGITGSADYNSHIVSGYFTADAEL